MTPDQRIDLGTRGKLFDRQWEVIGFMARADVVSRYRWQEYLLFNPYYGYRWLIEDKGHWLFVTPIKEKPNDQSLNLSAQFEGLSYKLYNRGDTEVEYVDGEFYWKVVIGQRVSTRDYVCPPYMLSSEEDETEVVWALSNYVDKKLVADAFKVTNLPYQSGVNAIQPSPGGQLLRSIFPYWIVFLILLTGIEIYHAGSATNTMVFSDSYPYAPNTKKDNAITSKLFALTKPLSNVEIDLSAPVDNSWLYVSGELVNETSGETYPFDRSIEYYHGYEDGESWAEGSPQRTLMISRVPSGAYYLNLDYESGDYKTDAVQFFSVEVKRDTTMYANYFWALFFLSIVPVGAWLRNRAFDVARWSNSDFNPYQSSE